MRMIDTHAHMDASEFDSDRALLFERMRDAGIEKTVIPGIAPEFWSKQLDVAKQFDCPFALGLHPWYCTEQYQRQLDELEKQLIANRSTPNLVALGECGLDKVKAENWSWQLEAIEQQLKLAAELELPVILHVVKAHNEMINVLKRTSFEFGGVIHAYSGSLETGLEYIKLGFKLGIGSLVVNKNAKKLRKAVSELPIDSLVIETDSPYMLPKSSTQTLHTPLFAEQYIAEVACLRKKTSVFISERLFVNSRQLFEI